MALPGAAKPCIELVKEHLAGRPTPGARELPVCTAANISWASGSADGPSVRVRAGASSSWARPQSRPHARQIVSPGSMAAPHCGQPFIDIPPEVAGLGGSVTVVPLSLSAAAVRYTAAFDRPAGGHSLGPLEHVHHGLVPGLGDESVRPTGPGFGRAEAEPQLAVPEGGDGEQGHAPAIPLGDEVVDRVGVVG